MGTRESPIRLEAQTLIFSARGQDSSLAPVVFFLSVSCDLFCLFFGVILLSCGCLSMQWCRSFMLWCSCQKQRGSTGKRRAEFQAAIFPQVACSDLQSEGSLEKVCLHVLEPGLAQPPQDKTFCLGYRSVLELESGSSHPKERQKTGEKEKPQLLYLDRKEKRQVGGQDLPGIGENWKNDWTWHFPVHF